MSRIRFKDDNEPATPSSGYAYLFQDVADGHLKAKKDTGTVVDLESSAGLAGPGSSTDNAIVRWDGTAGTTTQDSDVTISDTGVITIVDVAGAVSSGAYTAKFASAVANGAGAVGFEFNTSNALSTNGYKSFRILNNSVEMFFVAGTATTAKLSVGANTVNHATGGFSFGTSNTSSGALSVSFGTSNTASGASAFANGTFCSASGGHSFAHGYFAAASNTYAIAIGAFANAIGTNSVAIGPNTYANTSNCTAVGGDTICNSTKATALGTGATGFKVGTTNTVAFATGTVNTPFFVQGATRSVFDIPKVSIGDGATVGSEILTNGTFTGNATGWTLGGGWTYASNAVSVSYSTGALTQAVSGLVVGAVYCLTFTVSSYVFGSVTPSLPGMSLTFNKREENGTAVRELFIATATSDTLTFTAASSFAGTLDTVSLKQVTGGDFAVAGASYLTGALNLLEASNIVVGTSTGTKIGTATSQKLGFFNATPVVQQTGGVATAGGTYTATEQGMIQTAYDCLRTLGFLS